MGVGGELGRAKLVARHNRKGKARGKPDTKEGFVQKKAGFARRSGGEKNKRNGPEAVAT